MADSRVRDIAENAWLLLVSRAAAGLSIPILIGGGAWIIAANAQLAVHSADIMRHEAEIEEVEERITAREANAYTSEDAAAHEARVNRELDLILDEIRALRQEIREDRQARQ